MRKGSQNSLEEKAKVDQSSGVDCESKVIALPVQLNDFNLMDEYASSPNRDGVKSPLPHIEGGCRYKDSSP